MMVIRGTRAYSLAYFILHVKYLVKYLLHPHRGFLVAADSSWVTEKALWRWQSPPK